MEKPEKGKIYLIPIEVSENTGKEVLSKNAIDAIRHVNFFAVENIRTARRFIGSLKLGLDISSLEFHELTKHTPDHFLEILIQKLNSGKSAGIMSEAGCPGIADPGSKLVSLAYEKGIRVVPLVGPSSFVLALMASGLNGQKFAFHGYLPIDKMSKVKAIQELEKRSRVGHEAQIFMETPFRNDGMLSDILQTCQNTTQLCIASDITGSKEFIATKSVGQWKKAVPELKKIPTVFILQT